MKITERYRQDRLPFFASLGFGLAAYGFCMLNKIPVGDDLVALFDKGATTVSGRYGLELLRLVMPDASMPWIYGLMSLFFLALTVCVTLRLFAIRNRALQLLLAGALVCFPAEAGTLLYMFTAAPYALALLLTVTGLYLFIGEKRGAWLVSPLLLAFACSIYQGYFSVASSLCVVYLLVQLCRTEKCAREVFLAGVRLLAMLLLALALYGLALLAASRLFGYPLLQEVLNERQSVPLRLAVAYSAWLKTLLRGYFGYVPTPVSRAMHLALLLAAGIAMSAQLRRKGQLSCLLLAGVCLLLYPLSCYCLYLLADNSYIHSLSLYSFATLYVLCAALLDGWEAPAAPGLRRVCALCLSVILCGSLYFANSLYLRYYLRFEELKSFYTVLLCCVFETPDYQPGDRLALVGESPALVYDIDRHFPDAPLSLPSLELGSAAYAELIVSRYLGFDLPFASGEEIAQLDFDGRLSDMPVYPYDGSIKKIGDTVVVMMRKEAEA